MQTALQQAKEAFAMRGRVGIVAIAGGQGGPLASCNAGRQLLCVGALLEGRPQRVLLTFEALEIAPYALGEAERILGEAHITVNKNAVPRDPRSPFVTSGLRLGTPAITTRGFGTAETRQVTGWICDILDDLENEALVPRVREQVLELCKRFPVYA